MKSKPLGIRPNTYVSLSRTDAEFGHTTANEDENLQDESRIRALSVSKLD